MTCIQLVAHLARAQVMCTYIKMSLLELYVEVKTAFIQQVQTAEYTCILMIYIVYTCIYVWVCICIDGVCVCVCVCVYLYYTCTCACLAMAHIIVHIVYINYIFVLCSLGVWP